MRVLSDAPTHHNILTPLQIYNESNRYVVSVLIYETFQTAELVYTTMVLLLIIYIQGNGHPIFRIIRILLIL